MTTTPRFRILAADGRFLYPYDAVVDDDFSVGPKIHGWAEGIDRFDGADYRSPKFLAVPADRTVAEFLVRDGRPEIIGYRRATEAPSLPAYVEVSAWAEFLPTLGTDGHGDPIVESMYDAEREVQKYRTERFDLSGFVDFPIDVMDPGSLVDVDPLFRWDVAAPYLVFGTAYANALPGTLSGVRDRLAKAVEDAVPHARVYTHKAREGVVEGLVTLPYSDKRVHSVKRSRTSVNVETTRGMPFSYPLSANIAGVSKAAAIEAFHAEVADIVASINSITGTICSSCDGYGLVKA